MRIRIAVMNPNKYELVEPEKYVATYDYHCFMHLLESLLLRNIVEEITITIPDQYREEAIDELTW